MDVLKNLLPAAFFLLTSCSQLNYGVTQGIGQMRLIWGAKPNQQALNSSDYSIEEKRKIKLIEEYKRFFYQYWQMEPKDIYSKSYRLQHAAVSYLVISSPPDKIEAVEHCFPIAGCFPYLGFFDPSDAQKHTRSMDQKHYISWTRPVYAYSTLGHFNDPILSSFFYYDDYELANLVFHELFHTIFFIDGEVEFNENLANFFAEKLLDVYFSSQAQSQKSGLLSYKKSVLWQDQGLKQLVAFAQELNSRYQKQMNKTPADILEEYKRSVYFPWAASYCQGIDDCWATRLEFNNAALAAYLTYEAQDQFIEDIFIQYKGELRPFLDHIKQLSRDYQKEKDKKGLANYLRQRLIPTS